MSHIQALSEAKLRCDQTAQCEEYQTLLKHEYETIDAAAADNIQLTLIWGAVFIVLGILFIASSFIKSVHDLQRRLIAKIILFAPILLGLSIGIFIGLIINFSACFKQDCSVAEGTAIFTVPLATLLITVPFTLKLRTKRQLIYDKITQLGSALWWMFGLLIIAASIFGAYSNIQLSKENAVFEKQYIVESASKPADDYDSEL